MAAVVARAPLDSFRLAECRNRCVWGDARRGEFLSLGSRTSSVRVQKPVLLKNGVRHAKRVVSARLLPYPDPAHMLTDRVTFEDVFSSRDASTLEQLRNLSFKRQEIEESLSGKYNSKIIFDGSDSITQKTIQFTEEYLPLLYGFASELQSTDPEVLKTSESFLDLRWSSIMTHRSLLGNVVFFKSNDILFESAMVTFLYASLLRNLAFEVLPSDETKAATLLRKSSGVHSFSAYHLLPRLQGKHLSEERSSPETFPAMAQIWAEICLAEAQALTAAKAEAKNSKFSLISKLYFGTLELYGNAQSILDDNSSQLENLSSTFLTYLRVSRNLVEVKAWKFMAKEKSENFEGGLALGLIQKAKHVLSHSKAPGEKEWKKIWEEEEEEINTLLRKFELENDQIYRESVPELHKISANEALIIAEQIPFEPSVASLFLSLKPSESLL